MLAAHITATQVLLNHLMRHIDKQVVQGYVQR